jgi:hypothetical protein
MMRRKREDMSDEKGLVVRAESGLVAPSRFAFEPGDAGSAMELAKWVVKSRLFRSLETPEAVFIVLAQGRERASQRCRDSRAANRSVWAAGHETRAGSHVRGQG